MNSSSPSSSNHVAQDQLLDEMAHVCDQAAKGLLEPRVLNSSDDPRLAKMAQAINSLLDSVDVYVRESTASLKAASEHRYYRRVLERGMHGSFRAGAKRLNSASNEMRDQYAKLEQAEEGRAEVIRDLESTLLASSKRIGDAIQSIGKITRGTHILALNAKIEAARAGEAGRGFAIVAHEVEQTSQRVDRVMEEIDRIFAEVNAETHTVLAQVASRSKNRAA